ncbi:unnamed protein product, partial [Nesidiocoris tenuis]
MAFSIRPIPVEICAISCFLCLASLSSLSSTYWSMFSFDICSTFSFIFSISSDNKLSLGTTSCLKSKASSTSLYPFAAANAKSANSSTSLKIEPIFTSPKAVPNFFQIIHSNVYMIEGVSGGKSAPGGIIAHLGVLHRQLWKKSPKRHQRQLKLLHSRQLSPRPPGNSRRYRRTALLASAMWSC